MKMVPVWPLPVYTHWNDVYIAVRDRFQPGTFYAVSKACLPHPDNVPGLKRSIGLPRGQHVDYRWTAANCTGFHVQDFGDHYQVHIDRVSPDCSLIEHLRQDAPGTYAVCFATAAYSLGRCFGKEPAAAMAWAMGGFAIAAITLPPRRRTHRRSSKMRRTA